MKVNQNNPHMKMKKHYSIPVVGVLLLGLYFICCKNVQSTNGNADMNGSASHLTSLAVADSLISRYNAKAPVNEQFKKTKGNVNIVPGDNIISIEYFPEDADETVTYYLYTKLEYPELKSGPFGLAEVIYLGRNLIVNSLDAERSLFLFISGEEMPAYLKELNNVLLYQGYGLGYRRVKKDASPDTVPYCTCEPSGGRADFCGSGGEGALSCSVGSSGGSCRISCGGQTFPCCDKKMD